MFQFLSGSSIKVNSLYGAHFKFGVDCNEATKLELPKEQ